MAQAKVLNDKELKRVQAVIAAKKHAARNKAMLLLTFWAGMRVGEVAALLVGDVLDADGKVRDQIRLTAAQTKGSNSRIVVLPQKLQAELASYLADRFETQNLVAVAYAASDQALFLTQKHTTFSANSLAQHFSTIYAEAGLIGASSHSGRRSFITNLANKGVGVRVLMQLASHKHLSTTQRYIDCNDGMLRSAVELVA